MGHDNGDFDQSMPACARILTILVLMAAGSLTRAWAASDSTVAAGQQVAVEAPRKTAPAEKPEEPVAPEKPADQIKTSVSNAAEAAAAAALASAKRNTDRPQPKKSAPLPTAGKPGDVRLVVVDTDVIQRSRWIVPKVPIPPFIQWNKWLDDHPSVSHTSLDWMNDKGEWWHTELRGLFQFPVEYRTGVGEFRATGTTIYGIYVVPGRSDPEGMAVLVDEKVTADWRKLEAFAREYARKDKVAGEPGTGGKGERNVGLGGPAWRPTCNSNTFIGFILRQSGVTLPMPKGAIGWDRTPTFPFSSDADVNNR